MAAYGRDSVAELPDGGGGVMKRLIQDLKVQSERIEARNIGAEIRGILSWGDQLDDDGINRLREYGAEVLKEAQNE